MTNLLPQTVLDIWQERNETEDTSDKAYPDLTTLRWNVASGTISQNMRGFDFSPYITWPHKNEYHKKNEHIYAHEMVEDSYSTQDFGTRVFMSLIPEVTENRGVHRIPFFNNMQDFIFNLSRQDLSKNDDTDFSSRNVFSTLADKEPMRRLAMFGANCLLTAYCAIKGRSEQTITDIKENTNQSQTSRFHDTIIKHIKELPDPRYTPSTIVLPGLWKLLILNEKKDLSLPSKYQRSRTDQPVRTRYFDSPPWALKRFVQYMNLKTKPSEVSDKEKAHMLLLRNIIIQEIEKNLNALFEKSGNTVSGLRHMDIFLKLTNNSYSSSEYIKSITDITNESTLFEDYLKLGYRAFQSFDIC